MVTPLLDLRFAVPPAAAETAAFVSDATGRWIEYSALAIAVAIIMAAAAIATAMAQRAIGPAAIGAAAEDKNFKGVAILLLAIPETILIICAGIAYMLLQKVQ